MRADGGPAPAATRCKLVQDRSARSTRSEYVLAEISEAVASRIPVSRSLHQRCFALSCADPSPLYAWLSLLCCEFPASIVRGGVCWCPLLHATVVYVVCVRLVLTHYLSETYRHSLFRNVDPHTHSSAPNMDPHAFRGSSDNSNASVMTHDTSFLWKSTRDVPQSSFWWVDWSCAWTSCGSH